MVVVAAGVESSKAAKTSSEGGCLEVGGAGPASLEAPDRWLEEEGTRSRPWGAGDSPPGGRGCCCCWRGCTLYIHNNNDTVRVNFYTGDLFLLKRERSPMYM